MATLHLQSTWAGAHLGFPLTQLRGSAFVLAALFIVSGLILFGVSFLLGTPQGAAGATVVLAVAAIVVGFFWTGLDRSWFPALARAQIAVAFDYLGEEETADATNEGVAMWVFHVGPILDGGTGLALDPTHRMSDAEFADEAWSFATYDPTECEHLVDEWYWCW
ncbi:MAG: hypothetical protein R2770_09730 [Acidimicrobiales bacterium]|nr:hypothetical protein [Acidimicrobiales bacterium]